MLYTGEAGAQAQQTDVAVANLPRPGFESRTIRLGGTIIAPTLDLGVAYNDNIAATRSGRIDDAIFTIRPRIDIEHRGATLDLIGNVHAGIIRFAENTRENVDTFGAKLDLTKRAGGGHSLNAEGTYDRSFERRSDPEADFDRLRRPALINFTTGELRYGYRGARIGATAMFSVASIDYLPSADADRDLTTYRGSVRGLYSIGSGTAVFVEGFVTRRDNRLRLDRSGFDRDATTTGGLAGLEFSLSGKLDGDLGVGVFHADPDDRRLRGFTGLGASGRLAWHPRERTDVTFDVFRGDVASVRIGATGRVDTRASVSIDQEARHNLLLHGAIGLRNIHYRGTIDRDQRYLTGEVEARYLLRRHVWLIVGSNYVHRGADFVDDRFHYWQTNLGIRLAY